MHSSLSNLCATYLHQLLHQHFPGHCQGRCGPPPPPAVSASCCLLVFPMLHSYYFSNIATISKPNTNFYYLLFWMNHVTAAFLKRDNQSAFPPLFADALLRCQILALAKGISNYADH